NRTPVGCRRSRAPDAILEVPVGARRQHRAAHTGRSDRAGRELGSPAPDQRRPAAVAQDGIILPCFGALVMSAGISREQWRQVLRMMTMNVPPPVAVAEWI